MNPSEAKLANKAQSFNLSSSKLRMNCGRRTAPADEQTET